MNCSVRWFWDRKISMTLDVTTSLLPYPLSSSLYLFIPSVITVSASFSLYVHTMEDRVQCWVSFINHSPGFWNSLSLYLGSQGLLLPGLLLSSSPQPWGYGCALVIQTQILMLYVKPFIDWTIAQLLRGHILWLPSLVYSFCISVVDNSLPYLYFYLVCSLLWQIKPGKKTWKDMCILFYFSFLSCFMITEIMTRLLVFKYQHKILLTVNLFCCFEIII